MTHPESAPAPNERPPDAPLERFAGGLFEVVGDPATWRNVGYLLLSFPLGVAYFVLLVAGFSLGVGLLPIGIGLLVLAALLSLVHALGAFERALADRLLGTRLGPAPRQGASGGFFARLRRLAFRPSTWTTSFFLGSRFVLGIASFVTLVTLFGTSVGLMATPLLYDRPWFALTLPGDAGVDSFSDAAVAAMIGAALGLASLHVANGLAWLSARWAEALLEPRRSAPEADPEADPDMDPEAGARPSI